MAVHANVLSHMSRVTCGTGVTGVNVYTEVSKERKDRWIESVIIVSVVGL